ncbi:hypothetical protein JR316_0012593 [Psilocybe cubensis]|uniref:Uncharacterized protein n=1 Tax=Psilocybe cubensis TaxID=181762 RepID=A0ACB8GJA9_PSICU|nr:hypothetical protein JR316_0012593 [Psilocybe cubensis]KAH9475482.1 hypothetical protein JR316_0012593 [Psilocybe cubensis]
MLLSIKAVVLPLEIVDEIFGLAVQPCYGPKTQSAIALTSCRGRMLANKARFSTVYLGRYGMSSWRQSKSGTDTTMRYLQKRVSAFAELIRAGDALIEVVRTGVVDSELDWVLQSADFKFVRAKLWRVPTRDSSSGPGNGNRDTATPVGLGGCAFTLSFWYMDTPSAVAFQSIKQFIHSLQLDTISLYNVCGLQKGVLARSNIKHLVLYRADVSLAKPRSVGGSGGIRAPALDCDDEERKIGVCRLESLETDMHITMAEHAALFHSGAGAGHGLSRAFVFPRLRKLRLHDLWTPTQIFIRRANEMLLNTPVLEELALLYLPALERNELPPIETFESLCAGDPPPSLSEIILESAIDLRNGLAHGVRAGVRYMKMLKLDKLAVFLRQPGYKRVEKVVVRLGIAMNVYQPEKEDLVEGSVISLRDTVRDAMGRQLERKVRHLDVNVHLEFYDQWLYPKEAAGVDFERFNV